MKKLILFLALSFGLVSCDTPSEAYVRADRQTLDTVGQEWIEWARQRSDLSIVQMSIREDKLRSWTLRVEAGEKELGISKDQ